MCPPAEINFVPVDFPIPILAYSSPPLLIIGTTAASVSTLFTTVGQSQTPFTAGNGGLILGLPRLPSSKTPFTAGNGGLILGLPRLPSSDSIKPVSSPQIYAPAPQ